MRATVCGSGHYLENGGPNGVRIDRCCVRRPSAAQVCAWAQECLPRGTLGVALGVALNALWCDGGLAVAVLAQPALHAADSLLDILKQKAFAMKIERLAYLGFAVEDTQAWFQFARDGLGLTDARAVGETLRLRMDDRAWRIALHPASRNDLLYVGFEVDGTGAIEKLEASLRDRDIDCRRLTPTQLDARSIRAGIAFKDPDGLDLEVVYGHATASQPFESRLVRRFLTNGQGLGHIVISARDPDRSIEFYRSLGFETTDLIQMEVASGMVLTITFLHCNSRHHTLALTRLPIERRLEHFMVEVESIDEVIKAYNRMRRLGYQIRRHLGRHPNDEMLSFYVVTPAGFDVEVGWDGKQVGADWKVQTYDRISLWGHEASP